MHRVGLTGNIASGKSAVAAVWQRLGAAIIDADELARLAVAPGSPGLERLRTAFGDEVIAGDGSLDRSKLRSVVFADAEQRTVLEAIVHPEVARLRSIEEAQVERGGATVVVHVIPLLFEAGLEETVDEIVFVDSPVDVRLERLVRTRGLEPDEARRMVDAQKPAGPKRKRADVVIENTGTLAELERKAEAVWREIEGRASA